MRCVRLLLLALALPANARERVAMLVVQQGGPSMAGDLKVRDRLRLFDAAIDWAVAKPERVR